MDIETMRQRCLERLREIYPEPWFVWWGVGAGIHCDEAVAVVRPFGERAGAATVSDSLPIAELLEQLLATPPVDPEATLAQGGNYVTDDAVHPQAVWFNNGRIVKLVKPDGQSPYLWVGTDYQAKDNIFF